MAKPGKKKLLLALKAAVSLGLLAWLGARMLERDGVEALGARLGGLDAGWLTLAVGLHFAAVVAGVARWRLLLRAARISMGFGFLLRSFLVGRFVGAFTPSTTGLDGWRLFEVGRASGAMGRSAAAIAAEKLVGLVGMALVCAALVPFGGLRLMGDDALWLAALLGGGAALGLWAMRAPAWVSALAARLPGGVHARVESGLTALRESRLTLGQSFRAVGLGVASHLALSAVFFATARAVGVDVDASILLVVGNAIVIAVLLPLSIGGVGVREGVAVVLLAGAGVGATDAVLVALLGYLTGQLPALLGGAFMATSRAETTPSAA